MPDPNPIVYVVDDDASVRQSLELLVEAAGFESRTFGSAQEFLSHRRVVMPGCVVLDVHLPDLNGLTLQEHIAGELPVIFITGYGDVPTSVRAMKAGAVEFLLKPFADDALLGAICSAIDRSRAAMAQDAAMCALRDRFAMLTPRERQVMALVSRGRLNKQVGGELGISEITVKAHRGNMMRKMKACSLPDLVDMANGLGLRSRFIG
jgi:FixJ family two-component response regulator